MYICILFFGEKKKLDIYVCFQTVYVQSDWNAIQLFTLIYIPYFFFTFHIFWFWYSGLLISWACKGKDNGLLFYPLEFSIDIFNRGDTVFWKCPILFKKNSLRDVLRYDLHTFTGEATGSERKLKSSGACSHWIVSRVTSTQSTVRLWHNWRFKKLMRKLEVLEKPRDKHLYVL